MASSLVDVVYSTFKKNKTEKGGAEWGKKGLRAIKKGAKEKLFHTSSAS